MSNALIVLGSASPRRREILENLGVAHVVLVASIDEDVHEGELPAAYLTRIVDAKLDAVRAILPPELRARASAVLVADTSVIVDERILGKPGTVAEGCAMIASLAGRTHEVHTRFALAALGDREGSFVHAETVRTKVTFRPLDHARALAYAETGEGRDKAGGYAVQGRGAAFVSRIDGSYSNVVGLPACEVALALERLMVESSPSTSNR